jgi:DNA invertase Pin-like site-specific DNA recombinase
MGASVGYVRRSKVSKDSPGDVSREAQEATIRRLAAADGLTEDVRLYVDFGKSADPTKEARRTQWRAMITAAEAGQVGTIYAHDPDRLYRSSLDYARLWRIMRDHKVRIVTGRGVLGGDGSAVAKAFDAVGAVFAELELDRAKERAAIARETVKARGTRVGRQRYGELPGEDVSKVIEAFNATGTLTGAAEWLRQAGIRSRYGRDGRWAAHTIRSIVEYHAPGLLPRGSSRGRPTRSRAALATLLRCFDGTTLTPLYARSRVGVRVSYCCSTALKEKSKRHHPYVYAESRILPALKARATKEGLSTGLEVTGQLTDNEKEHAALDRRENALLDAAEAGLSKAKVRERIEAIRAERAKLAERMRRDDTLSEWTREYDPWAGDPGEVNRKLRDMLDYVQLDKAGKIVKLAWVGGLSPAEVYARLRAKADAALAALPEKDRATAVIDVGLED